MKCPKCESDMTKDCCLRCGYMSNGNQIVYNYKTKDKFNEQKLFNKNFVEMYRNDKTYISFILGPLYFSYKGHFILGTSLVFIDYVLLLKFGNILGNFPLSDIIMFLYIVLNRIIYASFSNTVCLFLDNIHIKIIKKYYKQNYMEKLEKYKHKKIYLFLTIIFYLVIITIFIFIRRFKNRML